MSLNHSYTELRVVAVHTCNPSLWKGELQGAEVQGHASYRAKPACTAKDPAP